MYAIQVRIFARTAVSIEYIEWEANGDGMKRAGSIDAIQRERERE